MADWPGSWTPRLGPALGPEMQAFQEWLFGAVLLPGTRPSLGRWEDPPAKPGSLNPCEWLCQALAGPVSSPCVALATWLPSPAEESVRGECRGEARRPPDFPASTSSFLCTQLGGSAARPGPEGSGVHLKGQQGARWPRKHVTLPIVMATLGG